MAGSRSPAPPAPEPPAPEPPAAPAPAKDRLVAAAEAQFRRFGYRRTTVEDVTREAGTGKGSFYLHFATKEEAYLAVVEASLARFLDRAQALLAAPGPVPQRLRALVGATAEHYGADELLRASLFGAAAGGPGSGLVDGAVARRAADIQRTSIRALLADTLTAGQVEGSIRAALDASAAAAVLFEAGWAIVRAELEGTADLPLPVALAALNEITGLGIMTRDPRRERRSRPGSRRSGG